MAGEIERGRRNGKMKRQKITHLLGEKGNRKDLIKYEIIINTAIPRLVRLKISKQTKF